jgi:hypothetical protein
MRFIEELEKLHLPRDKFAIFGSGPLAIRKIRENKDIDILIREDLWQKLIKKYALNEKGHLQIGNVEVCRKVIHLENVDKLIDNAEIINELKFVRLNDLLEWKKKMGREKDIKDIKLIEDYLKNVSF